MTKLTITSAFAAAAAAIKNPWVINNGIDLKGPFAGREAARAAKAAQELGGKIEKFELGNFEVEAAIPTTTIFAFGSHGLTNCPCCGVHLSNGVGHHLQEVNGKVIKHDAKEYVCMACDTEFGPAIPADAPKATKAPKKTVAHVNSSTIERPTKAVWHIADEMKAKNPNVRRKDVIAECIARGIANFTARTQYQQWFQVQKEMQVREAAQAAGK